MDLVDNNYELHNNDHNNLLYTNKQKLNKEKNKKH